MEYLGNKSLKQLAADFDEMYPHLDRTNEALMENAVQHYMQQENVRTILKAMPEFYMMQEDKTAFVLKANQSLSNYILEYERMLDDPFIEEEKKPFYHFLIRMFSDFQRSINDNHHYFQQAYPELLENNENIKVPSKLWSRAEPPMQDDTNDYLMSVEEAAVFLKLKEETIYSLKFKKKIPYHKKGKRLYFSRHEIITWIKEGRGKTLKEIENEVETYVRKKKV